MINKKTVLKSLIILSLIIIIIVSFIKIRNTLAKYETTATTERDVDVAFWIVDNSFKTQRLLIDDIYPLDNNTVDENPLNDSPFQYEFTVSNFNPGDTDELTDDKIAETDMEYELVLTATTNLPLSYKIFKNEEECTKIERLYTDTDGTCYREIKIGTSENPMEMNTINDETKEKTRITDTYIIQVTFPQQSYVDENIVNNRTNLEYPDLMENIQIDLTARQVIGE